MELSYRSSIMPPSAIRELVPFAEQAKAQGKTVWHLNIGQPDIETPPEIMNAIRKFNKPVLEYGPSKGLFSLRQAIASTYQRLHLPITADEVSITEGASEAVLFAYSVITDPGDEIIIFEPFYANYNGFAATMGVELVPITLRAENNFVLPSKDILRRYITPRTRAIQICSPNNPTGQILTKEEMQILVDLALEYDIFIINDEVYREFAYDGKKAHSLLEFEEIHQNAVVIDSISKQFSACGARIGCLISKNRQLLDRALKYGQLRLCPSTLGQIGAEAAYHIDPSYFEPIWKEYELRRDTVVSLLRRMDNVSCSVPSGTFYLMARLPIENAEDFARFLLTDFDVDGETIMIAPGPGFYATEGLGYNEIRIAFVLDVKKLERCMDILQKGLEAYTAFNQRRITQATIELR